MTRLIRRASPKEIIKIGTLLEEHYDAGKKDYRDGWSDSRIAAAAGSNISPQSVANVRRSLGMSLIVGGDRTGTKEAVEVLQKQVTNLTIQVARLHWMVLESIGQPRGPLLEEKAKTKFPTIT